MTRIVPGTLLLVLGGLVAAAAGEPGPLNAPVAPPATARGYAGSATCRSCHSEVYDQWAQSGHSRAMVVPSPKTVLGDFASGTRFESFGEWYRPYMDGTRYMMDVPDRTGARRQQEVAYVLGYRQVQMYLTRSEGRLHLLPLGWVVGKGMWEHSMENLNEFRKIGPEHQNFWANQGRVWDLNCEVCHHGVAERTFDAAGRVQRTDIRQMGVGCETCHAPAKAHLAAWRDMTPRAAGLFDRTIVNTARLDRNRGVSACVNCHTEYVHYFTDFDAGDDFYQSFKLLTFEDDDTFWPDGRPRRHSTRLQGLMQSRCFQESNMQCTTCHDPHGSGYPRDLRRPVDSDRTCLQCHEEQGARLSAHTRHAPESPGSRCVNCHMPRLEVNYPNAEPMRMHTIDVPLPELTQEYGVPNACTDCHKDRDVEWAVRWRDRWWGPSDHWRKRWTAQIVKGRADDPDAILPLMATLRDTEENPLMRASAAKFLGLLRTLDAVPLLIEVLETEKDPSIRVNAVDALRRLRQRTAAPALRAALHDENRIVRAEAAYALGRIQAVPWSGPDRPAYLAAVAEFDTYLEGYTELADAHVKLGNLRFDQNRLAEAAAEYRQAMAIHNRPGAIRMMEPGIAHENLGSVYWQQRRPAEAVAAFERAVAAQPDLYSARKKLAEALRTLGRLEAAAEQYEALVALAPEDVTSRLILAETYLRLRQPAQADVQVRAVLEAQPENPTARRLRLRLEREFSVPPEPGR